MEQLAVYDYYAFERDSFVIGVKNSIQYGVKNILSNNIKECLFIVCRCERNMKMVESEMKKNTGGVEICAI